MRQLKVKIFQMSSKVIPTNLKTSQVAASWLILLAIAISTTFIFILTTVFILNRLWDSLFHRSKTRPFESSNVSNLQKFSYRELKFATNGFNSDHFISKGGFGSVFHGVLRNGRLVAIKRLDESGASYLQVEREFQSEIDILGAISSPHIVSLLGYCIEKKKKALVYEYMPNLSLQDYLFSEAGSSLNWESRFQIILDVVWALEFLHCECDPPVIHGDIKPSNVLLDWEFRAKLSDFGLSKVKVEDDFGGEMFSQELGRSQNLWKSPDLSGNSLINEETQSQPTVDFAPVHQPSNSSKNGRAFHSLQKNSGSNDRVTPKGKEVLMEGGDSCSNDHELPSVEHSKELNSSPWWWRQDDSGELYGKDYVTEWIGSQISSPMESNLHNSPYLDISQLECHDGKAIYQENREQNIHSKTRNLQDWWKEEELDDRKMKRGSKHRSIQRKIRRTIRMPHLDLGRRFLMLKERSSKHQQATDNTSNEFSVKRGWRKRFTGSVRSETSRDLFSQELSSSMSMRGTLCYVAPEHGGCGYLMEKGDIYSLGVLILVIISGRRPLHVLNSPMELEKANLISWCRHLARAGNVLGLVDERLKDAYNKDQANLCVHLALDCLQRTPELRPSIGDVLKVLTGERDILPLTSEFSPSPPTNYSRRFRR